MTVEDKVDRIIHYFPDITDDQRLKFQSLFSLYEKWNNQINVISRKNFEHFYEQHVLHSLSIAKVMNFVDGSDVLDVGTGGGFPGIPLAIFYPKVNFHLVDSIGKKIKVVEEVASALNLENVHASWGRMEKVNGLFDTVVTRAVAKADKIEMWVGKKLKKGGNILMLKGGDLEDELSAIQRKYHLISISKYFDEPFFETKKILLLE